MRIVLDMNLPTSWVGFLRQEGIEAIHWSEVGDPRASDLAIMTWASFRRVCRTDRRGKAQGAASALG